jgi:hypothetical protein
LWVPKPRATWPDAPLAARPGDAGAWDDLRLVGLKQVFLIVTRAVLPLGLSRREWWWKDAAGGQPHGVNIRFLEGRSPTAGHQLAFSMAP